MIEVRSLSNPSFSNTKTCKKRVADVSSLVLADVRNINCNDCPDHVLG